MALMEQGLDQQANLIDTTQPTESWERAIALLLHAHCRPADAPVPESDLDRTVDAAVQLLDHPDPPTAAFQTRTGLSAVELDRTGRRAARVLDSLVSVARLDAYAARDALHHPVAASALDDGAADALNAVIAAAGLGSGLLSAHHHEALTGAVGHAETELERLLQAEPDPG